VRRVRSFPLTSELVLLLSYLPRFVGVSIMRGGRVTLLSRCHEDESDGRSEKEALKRIGCIWRDESRQMRQSRNRRQRQ
jgi:hypothetical protein